MNYKKFELKNIFTGIYETNYWGSPQSKSGPGSELHYTEALRKFLPEFIKDNNIEKMIDTSCGDWNWAQTISQHLPDYTGLDIVKNIVHVNNEKFSNSKTRFIHSDSVSFLELQADKSYDLILCRHTLEHLPSNYVISYLKEALRVGKYLLITSDHRYENIELPNNESYYRPINLELTPYDFMCKYLKDRIYDGPLIPVIDTAADLLLFET